MVLWKESLREGESLLTDCSSQSISSESLLRRASASSSEKVPEVPRGSAGQVGSMPASASVRGKGVRGSSFKERKRKRELMAMLSFRPNNDDISKTSILINPAPEINLQSDLCSQIYP